MKKEIQSAINHMVQGLAHWMAYRDEISNIQIIEADAVFVAADILRANLICDFVVEREISKKSLAIVGRQRIDVGIKSRITNSYECLIEFKLADATNAGYTADVEKLSDIKKKAPNIDCLVVILYRKLCSCEEPKELVNSEGLAQRGVIKIGKNNNPVKVRRVCNSFTSSKPPKSKKAICLEVL